MDPTSLVQGHRRSRVQQLCGLMALHVRRGDLPTQRSGQKAEGRKAALVHAACRDRGIRLVFGVLTERSVPGSAAAVSPVVGAESDGEFLTAAGWLLNGRLQRCDQRGDYQCTADPAAS